MLQKKEWRVQGKHPLRKKAPGAPLMVSEYATFEFGFGIKVSPRTLVTINRKRAEGSQYYSESTQDGKRVKKQPLSYYANSDSITVAAMHDAW